MYTLEDGSLDEDVLKREIGNFTSEQDPEFASVRPRQRAKEMKDDDECRRTSLDHQHSSFQTHSYTDTIPLGSTLMS